MAATWTILNTERTLKGSKGDDQITTLHWQCTDSETVDDVVHSGRLYGSMNIPEPSGLFIEYAKVTGYNRGYDDAKKDMYDEYGHPLQSYSNE